MRFLVTGSSGHLGEGLARTLREAGHDVTGLDRLASPFTSVVADVRDVDAVRKAADGVDVVLHTATLHKPHLVTHPPREFVETNVTGTLNVLEAALAGGVSAVVFTSTTSTFGAARRSEAEARTVWVDEDVVPTPRNLYGVTKSAADAVGRCSVSATARNAGSQFQMRPISAAGSSSIM